jgi:arabinogalactan endo-1,4-beta-galactosidase
MNRKFRITFFLLIGMCVFASCEEDPTPPDASNDERQRFIMGADLSYLNQLMDQGVVFRVSGQEKNPYLIASQIGIGLSRFRVWHHPKWTASVYGREAPLYSDMQDVEKSIRLSKEQNMDVLLNFHYSDTWADPGKQEIPEAWKAITSLEVLKDSVYQYTYKSMKRLKDKGLFPTYVQLGNETNCGMLYTNAPASFPKMNVCQGNWANFREVVRVAIKAVHDAAGNMDTGIIFHVADPKNLEWWIDNFIQVANPVPFDIIGFSYYPLWHTEVPVNDLERVVSRMRLKYGKKVLMLETAYPWTHESNDNYTNKKGGAPLQGFPFTKQGQANIMLTMAEAMYKGGGMGMIYWEPAWISSTMKDLWGTGSSWENCTFFDFNGSLHEGADYIKAFRAN